MGFARVALGEEAKIFPGNALWGFVALDALCPERVLPQDLVYLYFCYVRSVLDAV
jgi:hypothetical protein